MFMIRAQTAPQAVKLVLSGRPETLAVAEEKLLRG